MRYLLLTGLVVVLLSFVSCSAPESIEGLWISTEETSAVFPHGTQKTVLKIEKNQKGGFVGRGVFLWKGSYNSEWELIDLVYDPKTDSLVILDADGDSYKGKVDLKNKSIKGAVHLPENKKDPLDFIRAAEGLESKLFHPRKADKDGEVNYAYGIPETLNDGLETASLTECGLDSAAITSLMEDVINQEYGRMESFLILKDNKLVVEEYFYSYTREDLHPVFSCTKSITSILLGIALGEQWGMQVEQALFHFFPEYDSLETKKKEQIKLKHVLTMTAGLQWNEFPGEMYETDDWYHYILSRSMNLVPGEEFHYNSGLSILLGGVICSLVGKNANLYAEETLFKHLSISEFNWETHPDGTPQCGAGLHMLPRDMAKIGLLVLNDGYWDHKQIVSKEWQLQSTKALVPESEFSDYGYHWWVRSDPQMVFALGWGGQFIIVVKELNLVVITTASDYSNDKALSKIPMVTERIIPAITNRSIK